jgi:predicted DNA-binding protein (MmcQ/YjbR family)
MDLEKLRTLCLSLPAVTEGIKWEDHLTFMVGEKLFLVTGFEAPLRVSLKVNPDEFFALTALPGITQAPYFARGQWILISNAESLTDGEWERLTATAYSLVKNNLTKKKQQELGLL